MATSNIFGTRYWVGLGALVTLLSGCSGAVDDSTTGVDDGEHLGQTAQALGTQGTCYVDCGCDSSLYDNCYTQETFNTASTRVVVKYYQCKTIPSDSIGNVFATCPVEPDFRVIGGGTTVDSSASALDYSSAQSGPQLEALRGGSWATESRLAPGTPPPPVGAPPVYHATPFAIGIKLHGGCGAVSCNDEVDLENSLAVSSRTAPFAAHPSVTVSVPSGFIVLGGGFNTSSGVWPVDAYATGMYNGTWTVKGAAFTTSQGYVTASAISISRCVPAENPIFCFNGVDRKIVWATSSTGTGGAEAYAVNGSSGFAPVGVGVYSNSWSRPISNLFPLAWAMVNYGGSAAGTTQPYQTDVSGYAKAETMLLNIEPPW